jgi:hypothetical protein
MKMTVTTTVTGKGVFGSKKWRCGTYSASDTGGDIATGLKIIEFIDVQAGGASIVADAPTVNETLPLKGTAGAVTIIVTNATTGFWLAIGK